MENNKRLKVAVSGMPPFIMESNNEYSGFEVELWEMVAKEIRADFVYEKHTFQELIPMINKKEADIAFASITVNEKREELVDFSHPTFDSGLRILLSRNRSNVNLISTIKSFFHKGAKQLIKPLIFLVLIIFIFGNLLFLLERGNGSISALYLPGIFQATWISLSVILKSTSQFYVYDVTSWAGRAVMVVAQITSLAILGLIIGEITSFLTTKKIKLNIEGPKDLKGKNVVTVKGTTSEAVLKSLGATVMPVSNIEEGYNQLKHNLVDALVFDSPVLVNYLMSGGAKWAETVGEVFDKQNYGFVLPKGSSLRKDVNLAILMLRENGAYDTLYKKWFGETE